MRKICVINQKGGVGKTTTAVSVAAGLARREKRVLLIDVDPQGNIAHSLRSEREYDVYDFLTGKCSYLDCITNLGNNLDLIHSVETLTKLNSELLLNKNPSTKLKDRLEEITGYDYVIFDCAPSLGLINQNVMLFCDEALIPVSTNFLSLTGLTFMTKAIEEINSRFSHDLRISYIVPTMYDSRLKFSKVMLKKLQTDYSSLITEPIRINSKLSEAPSSGKSIFAYDKNSRGAKDYFKIVDRIIEDEKDRVSSLRNEGPISLRVQKLMADIELDD